MTSLFLLFLYVATLIDPIPLPWMENPFWNRFPHRSKNFCPSKRMSHFLIWLLVPCIFALGAWSAGYAFVAEAILLFTYGFLLWDRLLFCTTQKAKKESSEEKELPENLIVWSRQDVLDHNIFPYAQRWILPHTWILENPLEILKAVSEKSYSSFTCSQALRIALTQAWDAHNEIIEKQLDLLMKAENSTKNTPRLST